jgi:hypothetical protein
MIIGLLTGLIITVITGLAVLAYRRPKLYAKFFFIFLTLDIASLILFFTHLQTKRNGLVFLLSRYPKDKIAFKIYKDIDTYYFITLVSFLIAFVFLIFLYFLHNIINQSADEESK